MLIAEVTRILQESSSRQYSKTQAMHEHHIAEHNQWVRDSGRSAYEDPHKHTVVLPISDWKQARDRRGWLLRRSRANADLPDEMQRAVRQSVAKDGRMGALQLDVEHLHARQRGATASVMHERLCNWLRSEAGQAWSKERAKMLQADDTDGKDG